LAKSRQQLPLGRITKRRKNAQPACPTPRRPVFDHSHRRRAKKTTSNCPASNTPQNAKAVIGFLVK